MSRKPNYNLGPYKLSSLYIGVNPPWDSNPFFFELYHLASESSGFPDWTNDSIYNLDFTTAAYICMKNGEMCEFLTYHPYYFVVAEMVNLKDANVARVSEGMGVGYSVTGDEKTWVSNGTIKNSVDVAMPLNYTWEAGCMYELHYEWYVDASRFPLRMRENLG
jgi:hypothetical protein